MSKIVHLCMCGPVTDGWSYQDNLLTKYHRRLGYEVSIITSEWIWGNNGKIEKDNRSRYINEHGVTVVRLPIKYDKGIDYKFKRYKGLYQTITEEKPDIIFVHGCQFLDIWKVRKYLKKNSEVRAYVDNHADFSNSGTNFISREILHKIIWKAGASAIEPHITKFYGVLPARVDFLIKMYGIPKEKVELLVMGADDEKVEKTAVPEVKKNVRRKLGYEEKDFVVITGGKIDYAKRQILLLMEAVCEMNNPNLRLLIFGSVEEDIKEEFKRLCDADDRIQYIGWLRAEDTYQYVAASDLAVFPGRHSVIWEQVVGQGIPMVCKFWEGTTHVNVAGNTLFLYKDSKEEMKTVLNDLIMKGSKYQEMFACAKSKGKNLFSYRLIAQRAIEK